MQTYVNPVFDGYFADPFVLQHDGVFYAYGTAPETGVGAPALRSTDMVHWEQLGTVLPAFPGGEELYFWAPEVAFADGRFWMYYSAGEGSGAGHKLRVAVADTPEGPFVDCDTELVPDEPFSIDASPFRDEDGTWYLFYCKDFLEGERIGTGIVVDRLETMTRLAGDPQLVVRATDDWCVYEPGREWYGRTIDWHCVEGASVARRDGRYWCLFSGGRWSDDSYGVSSVVADTPLGPWRRTQEPCEPRVLRTDPGRVLGPGHCSIVGGGSLSADDWIVYHAWDLDHGARRMCIDRLDFTADGPRVQGPSTTPQPAPVVRAAARS